MCDDAGQFLGRHLAPRFAIQEPAREENAAIRGGKTIHRLYLKHIDLDLRQIQRGGHAVGQPQDRRIGQWLAFGIQHA